jgi:hypothetical protein
MIIYIIVCKDQRKNLRIIDILFVCLVVFNATFNYVSAISWRSVLLVEETGVPIENHRLVVRISIRARDLQLPMQSVPITTDVVSSNLDQGEVYTIM